MNISWQGWELHHLARRAKIFGIEKKYIDILEKYGWYLNKQQNIPPEMNSNLNEAILRLGSIDNFDKSCDKQGCSICKSIKEIFINQGNSINSTIPFILNVELFRWQKEAKKIWWDNGGKGIIKVVIGAGKTILAFSLISDLFNSFAYSEGGLVTAIIVPTSALLDQWYVGIVNKLNIPLKKIGIFYGHKKESVKSKSFLIYVINSARDYLVHHIKEYFSDHDVFLIADECHRYGSKENSRIFNYKYSYTLGLSATPERQGDYGFEEKLIPNLGKVIYNYSYNDALKDEIIPPYKLARIKVKLKKREQIEYENLSEQISKVSLTLFNKYQELKGVKPWELFKRLGALFQLTGDELITRFTILLNLRKAIIHTSISKLEALKWVINNENLKNEKVLIFHERIEFAERIYQFLQNNDFSASIYHSELSFEEKAKNVNDYREGKIKILVSCRALDEGFDVPESNVGIIVAGTSSVRQWIQRMGRILRKAPGKTFSKIFVVFVNIVERDVFKEAELKEFEREALSVEEINLTYI